MFRSISIYLTGLLLLIGTVSAVPVQNGGSVAGTLVARGGGNFGVSTLCKIFKHSYADC